MAVRVLKPKFSKECNFVIVAFYKFYEEKNPEKIRDIMKQFLAENGILGTILLGTEGINGSLCTTRENMEKFYIFAKSLLGDMFFKESYCDFVPFGKLKVKVKKEIVSLGIELHSLPGEYIKPEDWDNALNQPNTIVVDTRNDYEYFVGTFKNAINPDTKAFREFDNWINTLTEEDKDKNILMFCSAGIRCEKSTALMKDRGFKNVYHLEGGINAYLAEFGAQNKSWKGSYFVFDERIIVDANLDN